MAVVICNTLTGGPPFCVTVTMFDIAARLRLGCGRSTSRTPKVHTLPFNKQGRSVWTSLRVVEVAKRSINACLMIGCVLPAIRMDGRRMDMFVT